MAVDDHALVGAFADLLGAVEGFDMEDQAAAVDLDELGSGADGSPAAVAARWRTSTRVPTVIMPSARVGSTARLAACSISATSAGVANTSMAPEPNARGQIRRIDHDRRLANQPGPQLCLHHLKLLASKR